MEDIPVDLGQGRLDFPGRLKALIEIGCSPHVWAEYEKDPERPVARPHRVGL